VCVCVLCDSWEFVCLFFLGFLRARILCMFVCCGTVGVCVFLCLFVYCVTARGLCVFVYCVTAWRFCVSVLCDF
jgi:hypothetical protein